MHTLNPQGFQARREHEEEPGIQDALQGSPRSQHAGLTWSKQISICMLKKLYMHEIW